MLPCTRKTWFGIDATPCEHPAPVSKPYNVLPMNATSATPLVSWPVIMFVLLDGRPSTTVERCPAGLIREIRDPVVPPVYGPTAGTCGHCPIVDVLPPVPPSATYSSPS